MRNASKHQSSVALMRDVEDAIRASKKYTKYLSLFSKHNNVKVQGDDFPSSVVTEHYEVYPDMQINWDMSIIDAIFWLGHGTRSIKVVFKYSYPTDRAWLVVDDGPEAIKELAQSITGFSEALAKAIANGNGAKV